MPLTSPFVKTGMSGGGGFGGLAPNSAPVAATSGQVNNFPAGFPGGGGPASALPGGAGNPVTVGTGNQRQQSGGGTPGAGQVNLGGLGTGAAGMNLLTAANQNSAFSNLSSFTAAQAAAAQAQAVVAQGSGGRLFSRDRVSKFGDSLLSPNTFDPSEFPSLGNRDNSAPNPASGLSRPNYVGMVKQPAMETSEFTMSHEDFPALPGAPPAGAGAVNSVNSHDPSVVTSQSVASLLAGATGAGGHGGSVGDIGSVVGTGGPLGINDLQRQQQQQRGIQTYPDGTVTNIPQSMVTDQFGMIGLLTFIRAAETDQHLVSLALGADLTSLGLNLNQEPKLHPTLGGPFTGVPLRPQDIDYLRQDMLPFIYLTHEHIKDKLAPVKLNRYKEDVLFYLFYSNVGDVLQLAAAAELYSRDWRYHKEDKIWITRAPGLAPVERTSTYERGTFYFFDVNSWRKLPKETIVEFDKLEGHPSLPTAAAAAAAASAANNPNSQQSQQQQMMSSQQQIAAQAAAAAAAAQAAAVAGQMPAVSAVSTGGPSSGSPAPGLTAPVSTATSAATGVGLPQQPPQQQQPVSAAPQNL